MPSLGETIGSLLSDIATARARSDAFTREISQEYLRDPLLKVMPIPRAEIRSVELELSFAVSSAQPKTVDSKEIAARSISAEAAQLSAELIRFEPARTRVATSTGATVVFAPDVRPAALRILQSRVQALLSTEIQPELLLTADSASISKTLARKVEAALTEAAEASGATLPEPSTLQSAVDAIIRSWAQEARARIQTTIDRAKSNLALAIAVTKDELSNVSPTAIAKVKLQVEIQNLEWIDATDSNGTPGSKLVTR